MTRKITVFRPGKGFPSVSVTGSTCQLQCDHCRGRYLLGMRDVSRPGALIEYGLMLWERGGKGILVSGGCDERGAVTFDDAIFDQIRRLKEETGLIINLHTGLVDQDLVGKVAGCGADGISLDIVGSERAIREVLHLDARLADYERSYRLLIECGCNVIPHVLAGLYHGEPSGEREAVDLIAEMMPRSAVLIVLMPTKGTPMAHFRPMGDGEVLEIASYMRRRLDSKLVLGCMRPRGTDALEAGILDIGFDGIVQPSRRTVDRIRQNGWEMAEMPTCCFLI